MTEQKHSSIIFRSNLQPRSGPIRQDVQFLSKVWDIQTLTVMEQQQLPMTPAQQKVYRQTAIPCIYAEKGDFPFGTVRTGDGAVRVKCLCSNTDCLLFTTCRPDTDPHTLEKAESLIVVRCGQLASAAPDSALQAETDDTKPQFIHGAETDIYTEFLGRTDPPDSLLLEAEYAAVLWPQDLPILHHLLQHADELPSVQYDLEGEDHPGKLQSYRDVTAPAPNVCDEWTLDAPDPPVSGGRRINSANELRELLEKYRAQSWQRRFVPTSQHDVLTKSAEAKIIVNAGPGTGKTWTLIERIIALIEDGETAPEDIQVLCYSTAARQVVMERLRQAAEAGLLRPDWINVSINTFDSYAAHMLLYLRDNEPKWLPCSPQNIMKNGYDATIDDATKAISRHPEIVQGLRHLIVDELQDLVGLRANFLLELAKALPPDCGFTFFGDSCQAIYDYTVRSSRGMKADNMYLQLLTDHSDALLLSFSENKRSQRDIINFTTPLRDAILSDCDADIRAAVSRAGSNADCQKIKWEPQETAALFTDPISQGTTGLLTRKNGEALAVSTALHNADMPHTLKLTGANEYLAGWIGQILRAYNGETMDADDFAQVFLEQYPEKDPQPYWEALIERQPVVRERYEIRDLLKRLRLNAKRLQSLGHEELLIEPSGGPRRLSVMTIHRAKGREFDTVFIPDRLLDSVLREKTVRKRLEESRVCYVAITRARSVLRSVSLPQGAASIKKRASKDMPDRWYTRTCKGIQNFQIGAAEDIDPKSFAQDIQVQRYLHEHAAMLPGIELELRQQDQDHYLLCDRDNPGFVLGCTSNHFQEDLGALCAPTRRFPRQLMAPDAFSDIYVSRVITFVGTAAGAPPAARLFGDTALWLGLEISGFAKAFYDKY